jgi:hypothetical protein
MKWKIRPIDNTPKHRASTRQIMTAVGGSGLVGFLGGISYMAPASQVSFVLLGLVVLVGAWVIGDVKKCRQMWEKEEAEVRNDGYSEQEWAADLEGEIGDL